MTKRVCDICGKEMHGSNIIADSMGFFANFAISENGKFWDICDECRNELKEWIKNRRNSHDSIICK